MKVINSTRLFHFIVFLPSILSIVFSQYGDTSTEPPQGISTTGIQDIRTQHLGKAMNDTPRHWGDIQELHS